MVAEQASTLEHQTYRVFQRLSNSNIFSFSDPGGSSGAPGSANVK